MDRRRPLVWDALAGALLGVGAPIGFTVLRRVMRGRRPITRLATAYMAIMTPIVFAAFGLALGRREERVRRAREEVGRLAAIVAQDLRTPVETVRLAVEPLLEERDGGPVLVPQATLERVYDAAHQLAGMISELTDLTRVGTGRFAVRLQTVDLRAVLATAVAPLRAALSDHPIRIDAEGELPPVVADRLRLEQVTALLVDDAAEHAPPHTPIVVRATPAPHGAEIAVEDRGPLDPVRQHLVDAMVDAMHGRRSVDGATIRVFLPAAPAARE